MADDGARPGQGMAPPGGPGQGNVLAERFLANDDFHALYDAALEDLRTALYASGEAQEILDTWVAVLTDQASDLVPAETIESEASAIAEYVTPIR